MQTPQPLIDKIIERWSSPPGTEATIASSLRSPAKSPQRGKKLIHHEGWWVNARREFKPSRRPSFSPDVVRVLCHHAKAACYGQGRSLLRLERAADANGRLSPTAFYGLLRRTLRVSHKEVTDGDIAALYFTLEREDLQAVETGVVYLECLLGYLEVENMSWQGVRHLPIEQRSTPGSPTSRSPKKGVAAIDRKIREPSDSDCYVPTDLQPSKSDRFQSSPSHSPRHSRGVQRARGSLSGAGVLHSSGVYEDDVASIATTASMTSSAGVTSESAANLSSLKPHSHYPNSPALPFARSSRLIARKAAEVAAKAVEFAPGPSLRTPVPSLSPSSRERVSVGKRHVFTLHGPMRVPDPSPPRRASLSASQGRRPTYRSKSVPSVTARLSSSQRRGSAVSPSGWSTSATQYTNNNSASTLLGNSLSCNKVNTEEVRLSGNGQASRRESPSGGGGRYSTYRDGNHRTRRTASAPPQRFSHSIASLSASRRVDRGVSSPALPASQPTSTRAALRTKVEGVEPKALLSSPAGDKEARNLAIHVKEAGVANYEKEQKNISVDSSCFLVDNEHSTASKTNFASPMPTRQAAETLTASSQFSGATTSPVVWPPTPGIQVRGLDDSTARWLLEVGFGDCVAPLALFGVECMGDVLDPLLLSDEDLTGPAIGLPPLRARKFRRAVNTKASLNQSSRTSGNDEIQDSPSCPDRQDVTLLLEGHVPVESEKAVTVPCFDVDGGRESRGCFKATVPQGSLSACLEDTLSKNNTAYQEENNKDDQESNVPPKFGEYDDQGSEVASGDSDDDDDDDDDDVLHHGQAAVDQTVSVADGIVEVIASCEGLVNASGPVGTELATTAVVSHDEKLSKQPSEEMSIKSTRDTDSIEGESASQADVLDEDKDDAEGGWDDNDGDETRDVYDEVLIPGETRVDASTAEDIILSDFSPGRLVIEACSSDREDLALSLLSAIRSHSHRFHSDDVSTMLQLLHARDGRGATSLHIAAAEDHVSVVDAVLACHASFDSAVAASSNSKTANSPLEDLLCLVDDGGRTPLHVASAKGSAPLVETLLRTARGHCRGPSLGAWVRLLDREGRSALDLALDGLHVTVARLLIEAIASYPEKEGQEGRNNGRGGDDGGDHPHTSIALSQAHNSARRSVLSSHRSGSIEKQSKEVQSGDQSLPTSPRKTPKTSPMPKRFLSFSPSLTSKPPRQDSSSPQMQKHQPQVSQALHGEGATEQSKSLNQQQINRSSPKPLSSASLRRQQRRATTPSVSPQRPLRAATPTPGKAKKLFMQTPSTKNRDSSADAMASASLILSPEGTPPRQASPAYRWGSPLSNDNDGATSEAGIEPSHAVNNDTEGSYGSHGLVSNVGNAAQQNEAAASPPKSTLLSSASVSSQQFTSPCGEAAVVHRITPSAGQRVSPRMTSRSVSFIDREG